jgi:RNA polymerase sigma-70 factor (ECF subfamily)
MNAPGGGLLTGGATGGVVKPYEQITVSVCDRPLVSRRPLEPVARVARRARVAKHHRPRITVPHAQPAVAPATDEILVEGLRRGDRQAGEALVEKYCRPLMRYLQRLAGTEAAEELHQQTWLSVLANVDRFATVSPRGSFKAWLFRIATNKTKDRWRSGTREKSAKEGVRRLGAADVVAADLLVDTAEQGEKLERALAQLPEVQRQAVMLRYYSDLKFVDIAHVLGCPLNTALTRVHKALIKLRQLMED